MRGAGSSRNFVSTVPTEPPAVFVIRAIIPLPFDDAAARSRRVFSEPHHRWRRCMIRSSRGRVGTIFNVLEGVTMAETIVNNGVNVDALLAAREVLKGAPEAAKFTWRASCKWKNGTHSQSNVHGFFGLGEEQKHRTE